MVVPQLLIGASVAALAALAWLHAASAYLHAAAVDMRGLPTLLPIYYRVFLSLLTKPRKFCSSSTRLPPKRITTGPVSSHTKLLQFSRLCDSEPSHYMPLLYPAVLTFRLCLATMAAPQFPVSVLGGVLSGYRALQLRPVPASQPLSFRTELVPEIRVTASGNTEFDITVSAYTSTGEEVWRDCSTFTVAAQSRRRDPSRQAAPAESPDARWRQLAHWHLRSDAGRRFAAANGDINPIHMAAWCAKLFGFRSNIAHGMLLLARFVRSAEATGAGRAYPRAVQAHFRRPVFLPGRVVCSVRDADAPAGIPGFEQRFGSSLEFAVHALAGEERKSSVEGWLCWAS